jgi:hypothetical protein
VTLWDLIIPRKALRWGKGAEMTAPPDLEVTITVDTSGFDRAMRQVRDALEHRPDPAALWGRYDQEGEK